MAPLLLVHLLVFLPVTLLVDGKAIGAPAEGQAWVAQGAADRLGVAPGDAFSVGTTRLTVGGILDVEPDRLGEGFQLGPTVIVRSEVPASAGLTAFDRIVGLGRGDHEMPRRRATETS